MTLVELIVAMAVVTVGIVGLLGSFTGIQRAIQVSKDKTIASNLAQEKMQILRQQTYFRVLPTVSPLSLTDGTLYDPSSFPPETILEGGVTFRRYTYIQVVTSNNGVLGVLPPTNSDTGLRQIVITVAWSEGGAPKKLVLTSVMSNPNTIEANSVFAGTVLDAQTNLPIPNALVDIAENLGWRSLTDASGSYSIPVSPGNYNLMATADGYFSQYFYQPVAANNTTTTGFLLQKMSSGSVTGTAWVNSGPVISQVVASTVQAQINNMVVQYIELYNPTPNAVVINAGLTPSVKINFQAPPGCSNTDTCADATYGIKLNYINNTLAPYSYYLVANTSTFMLNGIVMNADAVFTDDANTYCSVAPSGSNWIAGATPPVKNILDIGHGGSVWLTDASGNVLDSVGWTHGPGQIPPFCAPNCIPFPSSPGLGLADGEELVRTSSPNYASSVWGRAYDAGISSIDFVYPPIIAGFPYQPFSSASPAQTPIAGRPAIGAIVSATDGLSDPATAVSAGYPPVASFALPNVATGTWTVLITSGSFSLENDTVTIAGIGSIYDFPSSTTMLDQPAVGGFISGHVTDALGSPISVPASIKMDSGGAGPSGNANTSTGRYVLPVSTGVINVTANAGNSNPDYIAQSSQAITVGLGQVVNGVDFTLSQGGRLNGFVTRDGINGLQGVTMLATDANGNTQDQEITDVGGRFTTIVLAVNPTTAPYTVTIPLDTTESSTPTVVSANVVQGQNVWTATFTVVGALGTISGKVTSAGSAISTGVLIVASTGTLPSGPPSLSSSTLTSGAYYVTSSKEDGSYSLDVRQSTYNVYGYYSTISGGVVTTTSKSVLAVPVVAGQTLTGKDLSW